MIDVIECPAVTTGLFRAANRGSAERGAADEAGLDEEADAECECDCE